MTSFPLPSSIVWGNRQYPIVPCTTLPAVLSALNTLKTLLEATAISMQEAKENLVSDLIQDKSMCTHLLFIAPISSRRDTVLEFQGYPRCLCGWKTGTALRRYFESSVQIFPRSSGGMGNH